MIVPFVFNLEPVSDYDHLSVFYFYLSMAKRYGYPIIAHERYFQPMDEIHAHVFSLPDIQKNADYLQYDIPTDADLASIQHYKIPQDFEDAMLHRFPSRMDCWVHLLLEEDPGFEALIGGYLDDIAQRHEEPIEAILCFYAPIALRSAARKRGIPVIHQEGTCFRPPFYRFAGYFDFKESYGRGELEERYHRFLAQCGQAPVKLFSRKEICALFMTARGLNELPLFDSEPQYEIGVGLVNFNIGANVKDDLNDSNTLLLEARQVFPMEQILTRGRYSGTASNDNSPTSYHFILKCKRVAALHSNLSFEAMLLDRVAYVYGASPYAFISAGHTIDRQESHVPLEFINFAVFGYFVPWELLREPDYIRWRLTKPSETEIYNYHMLHYLKQRGLTLDALPQEPGAALETILALQTVQPDPAAPITAAPTLLDNYNVLHKEHAALAEAYEKLLAQYELLSNTYTDLNTAYTDLESKYNELI